MTKIEALRLEADARELVEGTGLEWWQVIKYLGRTKNGVERPWSLDSHEKSDYELALGIVEGKPVWKGDTLYDSETGAVTLSFDCGHPCRDDGKNIGWAWERLSWNPPKPKTVMVELLVREDYNRIQDPENKIPEDEPVFLLRAQDKHAADAVAYWAWLVQSSGGDRQLVKLATEHSEKMRAWKVKKAPDL